MALLSQMVLLDSNEIKKTFNSNQESHNKLLFAKIPKFAIKNQIVYRKNILIAFKKWIRSLNYLQCFSWNSVRLKRD